MWGGRGGCCILGAEEGEASPIFLGCLGESAPGVPPPSLRYFSLIAAAHEEAGTRKEEKGSVDIFSQV